MTKPTSLPIPDRTYRDAHGQVVSVVSVGHNRVTFYRKGYQFPCVQPVERFLKEFTEVAQ
ncbi:DUF4222 domain-containing protein [Pluralibacter gergoviae]|uniref:DUF4222 domain-containing protein n=1 Tax=Pluralibacter gergoviae TaxID=61647 RepID=UPI0007DAB9B8|nr:DUF4222 domain-containing protein [Pluralibacter gergoviae]EKV0932313.1 DUF4222 domain-containing protein [Pluralibacter gergoviae]ELD4273633.1 DUF4222 domain-containing protein [Pluralibacter gergoviae]ELD4274720.1 DUF4222 domain-containing protein [Pluralibacter gergoviae]ELD4279245.1 DUF4222 domain-containing protein [Pluralibacter gergoviae]ELD4280377.1 DUF4222 domain-containing protein [Pluralibacter gergoviae]